MKVVIPGGTGQIGGFLARWFRGRGDEVVILGRSVPEPHLRWDARSDGPWFDAIDGADLVINMTGRTVNCRYHWANLNEMMRSRIDSCLAVGRAIAAASRPPKLWLQGSTATIYAHNLGEPFDENGPFGGDEPDVPAYWGYSVHIARAWELALAASPTPNTRKIALRTGFTMSPDPGGIFDVLMWLVRRGLGGPFYGGDQYVSWLYDEDMVRICAFLMDRDDLEGPVNLTAPTPIRNAPFMAALRRAAGVPVGVPVPPGIAELGAVFLGTDVELMRKSRRVVPRKLLDAGFVFTQTDWEPCAEALVRRWRAGEVL